MRDSRGRWNLANSGFIYSVLGMRCFKEKGPAIWSTSWDHQLRGDSAQAFAVSASAGGVPYLEGLSPPLCLINSHSSFLFLHIYFESFESFIAPVMFSLQFVPIRKLLHLNVHIPVI